MATLFVHASAPPLLSLNIQFNLKRGKPSFSSAASAGGSKGNVVVKEGPRALDTALMIDEEIKLLSLRVCDGLVDCLVSQIDCFQLQYMYILIIYQSY